MAEMTADPKFRRILVTNEPQAPWQEAVGTALKAAGADEPFSSAWPIPGNGPGEDALRAPARVRSCRSILRMENRLRSRGDIGRRKGRPPVKTTEHGRQGGC